MSEANRRANRKYYQQHPNRVKEWHKKYRQTPVGRLRKIFDDIKQRCNNPNCKSYKHYGGRGIKCLFTSDEFVDYVINTLRVSPKDLDIDRVDNDGNYEPGNIRFITHAENLRNRRTNNVY